VPLLDVLADFSPTAGNLITAGQLALNQLELEWRD
jgi:hypothetical protein